MKAENFVYWLQGYVEIAGGVPTPEQWQIIKEHLDIVEGLPHFPWRPMIQTLEAIPAMHVESNAIIDQLAGVDRRYCLSVSGLAMTVQAPVLGTQIFT